MAIKFEREAYTGKMDAFWRREVQMLPGGFQLKQTFPVGTVIHRGAFVSANVDNLSAAVVKVGQVVEGGTTQNPRVSKKNYFSVGDTLMKVGKNDAAVTVKSIDTSNPNYDVVGLSAAVTTLAKGDFLQEAVKDGDGSTYKPAYVANTALGADLEIRKSGLPTIDAAYGGVLLKQVIGKFPEAWLAENGFCLATNHNILIINQ